MNEMMDTAVETLEEVTNKPGFFSRNKQGLTYGAVAVGGIAAGAVGMYFYNQAERKRFIEQIDNGLTAIDFEMLIQSGQQERVPMKIGKGNKEIDTATYVVENNMDLQRVIINHLTSGKLRKKERENWAKILSHLVRLAAALNDKEKVSRNEIKNDGK